MGWMGAARDLTPDDGPCGGAAGFECVRMAREDLT